MTNLQHLENFLSNYTYNGINAWELFKDNTEMLNGSDSYTVEWVVGNISLPAVIGCAFMWGLSTQRVEYWTGIEEDWIKYCEVHQIGVN